MKSVILVRIGEIVLKGLNRPMFEDKLISNMKKVLYGLGKFEIIKSQSRIYVEPESEEYDVDEAMERLTRVFGVVSVSPVVKIISEFEQISQQALILVRDILGKKKHRSFKVITRRGNKNFPLDSMEINREIGGRVLEAFPEIAVDVSTPDFVVYIEVRESTYLYSEIIQAHGGMPVGTNGKALLLLSGGIDSPVAGWMLAKRGVEIDAIHFYSYPYTSERSKDKVIELARIVSLYCYQINLYIIPFTDIQLQMNENCAEDILTIIMRRFMMRISEKVARHTGSVALITGESMGQVASQTMQSLVVTNEVVGMPVFRPLIGMDKNEVIQIARKINTFETSILPFEDCCTVFVAKHPKTKPNLEKIILAETKLSLDMLEDAAIKGMELIKIKNGRDERKIITDKFLS